MNNNISDLESILGKKSNWKILQKVHRAILSNDKEIKFRVFPIYIQYFKDEKIISVLYYKGKFVNSDEIDVGFNLDHPPKLKLFKNAEYMHYPNINYSCKLKCSSNTDKFLSKIMKLL